MDNKVVVTCLRGARQGERVELAGERTLTFGRRPECDVVFPVADEKASGRHFELAPHEGRWRLKDLGSLNGTWIGDERVSERDLGPSTVVELGRDGPLVRIDIFAADQPTIERTQLSTPAMAEFDPDPAPGLTALASAATTAASASASAASPSATSPRRSARRSTTFYKLIIEDTVKRSSRRLRNVVIALSAGFVVAVGIVIAVVAATNERIDTETSASRAAQSIATRYAKSVFMLIAERDGKETGFCTAFAISLDGVLATNAHCVRELKDLKAQGGVASAGAGKATRILARMNTAPESTFEVIRWKEHPDYDGTDLSPDVALVGIDLHGATLPVVAEVATRDVAVALAAGQPIYTIGFPGQVMNEARPAADLRAAVVSRLTTRDNTPGDAASAYVVWHSALTSKGTSGSPIFDQAGRVVAVNNGGLSARELLVADPESGKTKRLTISEATGLNYGIRADRLADLIAAQ